LIIRDENVGVERTLELTEDVTTAGRNESNSFVVDDEKASRHHFRIEKDGEYYKVIDLGSTNGTELNGEKITEAKLNPGDQLRIGKVFITYEGPGRAKPEEKPAVASSARIKNAKAGGPKYVLEMLEGEGAGMTYEAKEGSLTMGRHHANAVVLQDEKASNYHAEITRSPLGWVISDLGSTNGTRLAPPGSDAYEKIVKAALLLGARIRIGQTVLVFKNIGEPAEGELSPTVAMSEDTSEALRRSLPPAPTTSPSPLLSPVLMTFCALAVFLATVWAVLHFLGTNEPKNGSQKPSPPDGAERNLVLNGDFGDGADNEGRPMSFRVLKDQPDTRVSVSAEAECRPQGTGITERRAGVRIVKSAQGAPDALVSIETDAPILVDVSKSYLLAGHLRNIGDGLCGLRITWEHGARKQAEHYGVLAGPQEQWRRMEKLLRPPNWAERARVGFFVRGNDGSADLDELYFGESRRVADPRPKTDCSFKDVSLEFDGDKGGFQVRFDGQKALGNGTLSLVSPDKRVWVNLDSAVDASWPPSGNRVTGRLFDYALQRPRDYVLSARQGQNGVKLQVAVNPEGAQASSPCLVFYVVGAVAGGAIEAKTDAPELLRSNVAELVNWKNVNEIIFNTGGRPQVVLTFESKNDVDVVVRPEGAQRRVELSFVKELGVNMAPLSVAQQQRAARISEEIQTALNSRKWAEVLSVLAEAKKSSGFDAGAANNIAAAEKKMAAAWAEAQMRAKNRRESVAKAPNSEEVLGEARKTLAELEAEWKGTEHERFFKDVAAEITALAEREKTNVSNQLALHDFRQAENAFLGGQFTIAVSFCEKVLREHPNTPAAEEVKNLLAKAKSAHEEQKTVNDITDRLLKKCQNFLNAEDYEGAIRTVQTDEEYQKYLPKLKELNAKLDVWRRKQNQKNTP
jgi:pSer/pThr/pTyr-binding forkhead associated (FHA) protein